MVQNEIKSCSTSSVGCLGFSHREFRACRYPRSRIQANLTKTFAAPPGRVATARIMGMIAIFPTVRPAASIGILFVSRDETACRVAHLDC